MGGKSDTGHPTGKKVVVLGGGLGGLSAARTLLDHGYRVTLIEKRPFLGGRAFSFYDPQVDGEVDNGQHVFMGCCTYYIDLLVALGTINNTSLQHRLKAEVVLNGRSGILSSVPALGALHLLPSFLLYPHLGLRDKMRAAYGLISLKLANRHNRQDELDEQTLYDWLKRHGQTERAIDNLWNLIILPTMNDDIRNVSAEMGIMVLQEGLLKKPKDATLGYAKVGLTSLTGEPARKALENLGGHLVMGKTVRSMTQRNGEIDGVDLSDGSVVTGDAYVSALPFDVLSSALPDRVAGDVFFSRISRLSSAPIVGIHIWYDRPVMDREFVAFLDSPVQWVFNKSLIQGADDGLGQYVCVSVSGAWDFINRPKEELREIFTEEMVRLFPEAREAAIQRFLVVKQPQATFRCIPGTAKLRPTQVTPIRNLFLAGEWTDTGWPSTMEGAVRSGVFAADAVASRI